MSKQLTPLVIVDRKTNKVVAEFASQKVCSDLLRVNYMPVVKRSSRVRQFGGDYLIKYKEDAPANVVYTPKAWRCEKHEVWVARGVECPLCVIDKNL